MKQPNAYQMFDQTRKQTMALKTPLRTKFHIHKIKNMHHTYNNPILCPSSNTVNIHSSLACLSELDYPATHFHGKIHSCYPPVCYIHLVPPYKYISTEYCFLFAFPNYGVV